MFKPNLTEEQYQTLYSREMPRLYRCALYLLGDPRAAEFAVLETWERSLSRDVQGLVQETSGEKFCKNLLYVCSKIEKETHYMSEKVLTSGDETLVRALAALTFEDRKVMVLSLVYGYPPEDIARVSGCKVGMAEKRLNRATARMTRQLRQRETVYGRESA